MIREKNKILGSIADSPTKMRDARRIGIAIRIETLTIASVVRIRRMTVNDPTCRDELAHVAERCRRRRSEFFPRARSAGTNVITRATHEQNRSEEEGQRAHHALDDTVMRNAVNKEMRS